MTPSINIDDIVYEALQAQAEPFTDTPNSVLRRLLGLGVANEDGQLPGAERHVAQRNGTRSARRRKRGPRAPAGSLLPEEAYELPILQVLDRHGGRAPTREVVEEVGALLRDQLKELDHETTLAGVPRWQSRIQFTRLRLVERDLMASDSPRGVWEITDKGRSLLAR